MSAHKLHDWARVRREAPNGSAQRYACRRDGCDAVYEGAQTACLAPAALQARIAELAEAARDLSVDMRAARDAAEAGEKAAWRYPLRHIERAVAHIERAAK